MLGPPGPVEGHDGEEARHHLGVAGAQAPGLLDQPVEPFEAAPGHQPRRARDRADVHVEGGPDPHGDDAGQGRGVRLHEELLLGRAQADPEDLGAVGAQARVEVLGLGLRQRTIREGLGPGHDEARRPPGHLGGELVRDAGTAPEEEVAPAGLDPGAAHRLDGFDARHLRDGLVAAQAPDPGQRPPVGADQQGGVVGGPHLGLVLRPHDAVGVAEDHEGPGTRNRPAQAAPKRGHQASHVGDRDRDATEKEVGDVRVVAPGAHGHGRIRSEGARHAAARGVAEERVAMASR
jgi:hypothetical protein